MSVNDCIEHAASLGVKGIELVDKQHIPNYPHQSVRDLEKVRSCIESSGCEVSCYSTYIDLAVRSNHWATREEQIDQILEDILEARILGAEVYRPTYWPVDPNALEILDQRGGPNYFEYFAREIKKTVTQVLPTLKKYDVKWGMEIHAPMPPEVCIAVAREVKDEYFGLIPDFSAWQEQGPSAGYTRPSSFESFGEAMQFSVHVHAKAHVFDENGNEPNTPYDNLIPIITKSGFTGYISAEYEGWLGGFDPDSREMARKHIELIQRYLQP